jgi:hypothetical protein
MKHTVSMNFLAEIKKVEAKKLVSNDIEIRVHLVTDDTRVLDLGKLPSDTLVKVSVEEE